MRSVGSPRKLIDAEQGQCTNRPSTTPHAISWVNSVSNEQHEYTEFAAYCKIQLEHAIRSSEHQGIPNAFRIAVVFELLGENNLNLQDISTTVEAMSIRFQRYESLLQIILKECERSVYLNLHDTKSSQGTTRINELLSMQPYFTAHVVKCQELQIINDEISELDIRHKFMMNQLTTKENIIDRISNRWARTTFRRWRNVMYEKQKIRLAMKKAMTRWKKRHTSILFRLWRQVILSEKQTEARMKLSTLTLNAGDCKETQQRLEISIRDLRDDIQSFKRSIEMNTIAHERLNHVFSILKDEIWHSQERQLQIISNEWGKLCLILVDTELLHLKNMIDSVSIDEYRELNMILKPREDKFDLLKFPQDIIILRWISHIFHRYLNRFTSTDSELEFLRIQNFTSDLKGIYVLTCILREIEYPKFQKDTTNWSIEKIIHQLRVYRCPEYLVHHVEHHYANPSADVMFCLFSFLFCEYTSLIPNKCPWQEAIQAYEEANMAWNEIRQGWSELNRPFNVSKLNEYVPDVTHVSAVVHAKESLQNATQIIQYACASRGSSMQLCRTGIPYQFINRREAHERALYTTLNQNQLNLMISTENKMDKTKLEFILNDHYVDIQRIFKYYAASDVGDACSMSLDEFYRFIKDSKLLSKSFNFSFIKELFHNINKLNETEYEFGPTEFILAIICIAERRFLNQKLTLSQRLKKCMEEYILVYACRSSTDTFRQQLNTMESKAVYGIYQEKLEKIYQFYATYSSILNIEGFMNFLENYKLISEKLTKDNIQHILLKIQQENDEINLNKKIDYDSELTFTEFCEALGAISIYYNSNIFIPFSKRLNQFLSTLNIPILSNQINPISQSEIS